MKNARSLPFIALMLCSTSLLAQTPQAFSYQAVMRDAVGHPITGHTCSGRYLLRAGVPLGAVVYQEQHMVTTNDQGLFTVQVGSGTPIGSASFGSISWRNGPYFLEVQIDLDNTGSFTTMGTQQLLSVPYALYAESSNIPNGTEVGQIAHWDGTTWVVDSGLYVHQKRFGIGITTPEAPLGIVADSTTGSAVRIYQATTTTTPGPFNINQWNITVNPTGGGVPGFSIDDASSGIGSSSRLFIADSTGDVGIGTTAPGAPLSIKSRSYLYEEFKNGDIPNENDFQISSGGGTGLSFDQDTTGGSASRLYLQGGTGYVGIGTQDPPAPLAIVSRSVLKQFFETGDHPSQPQFGFGVTTDSSGFGLSDGSPDSLSNRLFIQSGTGHVGIGTQDPPAPLAIVSRNVLKSFFQTGDKPSQAQFGFGMTTDSTGFGLAESFPDSLANRLFVASSTGHVGIGTQDPPAALAIETRETLKTYFETGDVPTADQFGISTGATGFDIGQGAPDALTSRIFISKNKGSVGIGTTTPTEKLHIEESTTAGVTGIRILNTATLANNGFTLGHRSHTSFDRDGAFSLIEQGAIDEQERITVLSGGNVGINEVLPHATLHVSRSLSDPNTALSLSENSGIAIFGPITDNVVIDYQGIQARALVAGTTSIVGHPLNMQRMGGDILIHGDATIPDEHRVTITSDGRIGVGKSATERLDVNGAITIGDASSTSPADGTIRYNGTDFEGRTGGDWAIFDGSVWQNVDNSDAITYSTGTTPRVGIGTNLPDATLHVSRPIADPGTSLSLVEHSGIAVLGPITDNLVFDYRGLQARQGEFIGDVLDITATTLNLQRLGGDILIHGDASFADDSRVMISSDGKLGLGKSPTERLDVNGAITLGDASSTTPANGTIRWSGTDFEGRSSGEWVPFDAGWRRVVASNDVHHNARVGIGVATPTSALDVVGQGSPTEGGAAASVGFIDSALNLFDDKQFIGLRVYSTSTQSPGGTRKNIGLYVSEVAGQPSSENNLAALLNGNTVIGDLVPNSSVVGTGGTNVLAIQNGTMPSSAVSSSSGLPDGGVQLYSASGSDGVSSLHIMRGNGDVIKLYKAPAITLADASPLGPGVDPGTAALIDNMRTRINQLEQVLTNLGVLTTP